MGGSFRPSVINYPAVQSACHDALLNRFSIITHRIARAANQTGFKYQISLIYQRFFGVLTSLTQHSPHQVTPQTKAAILFRITKLL